MGSENDEDNNRGPGIALVFAIVLGAVGAIVIGGYVVVRVLLWVGSL